MGCGASKKIHADTYAPEADQKKITAAGSGTKPAAAVAAAPKSDAAAAPEATTKKAADKRAAAPGATVASPAAEENAGRHWAEGGGQGQEPRRAAAAPWKQSGASPRAAPDVSPDEAAAIMKVAMEGKTLLTDASMDGLASPGGTRKALDAVVVDRDAANEMLQKVADVDYKHNEHEAAVQFAANQAFEFNCTFPMCASAHPACTARQKATARGKQGKARRVCACARVCRPAHFGRRRRRRGDGAAGRHAGRLYDRQEIDWVHVAEMKQCRDSSFEHRTWLGPCAQTKRDLPRDLILETLELEFPTS